MPIETVNPATGAPLETFRETSPADLDRILDRARAAFPDWRQRPMADRGGVLTRAAGILRERKAGCARTMALEMGKPVTQGEAEAEKCAWVCEYYAEQAERFLAEQPRETDAGRSLVRFDPLGPVLAVMPWNFPFWQVFRFAAPALAAGNTGILKHASNVPRCALDIESIFREAGAPEGVFRTILVGSDAVAGLIADPRIAAVTLTGSEAAGRSVGAAAGQAIKRSVLELGGSDPFIVLEDADIPEAARVAAQARLLNSGQSCIAAKRFIVVEPVLGEFLEFFTSHMESARLGDPLSPETDVGPQARTDLRDALHQQVQRSREQGARIALGGSVPDQAGAWYPPTILEAVEPGMAAFDQETFGPVAAVIAARDQAHALALANQSRYGLGASLWTRDLERAERLVPEIEAGAVFVNGLVKSDPRLPFGGVKQSGYGRELSEYGIREFVNIKAVWVKRAGDRLEAGSGVE